MEYYSAIKKDQATGTENKADEPQMTYGCERSQIWKAAVIPFYKAFWER